MANVSPDPNSGAAGTEYETISALRRAGCSVDEVWREDLTHWISHPNLHNLIELPIAYRNAMLDRLQKSRYDIVHVNQPHGHLAAQVLAKRCAKSRFVHRSHGFEGRVRHDLKPWLLLYGVDGRPAWRRQCSKIIDFTLLYSDKMIARHAHGHIVSASDCKTFLMRRHGVEDRKVAVVPQAAPKLFNEIKARPMDETRAQKILYVGQYAFFKAPFVLVRAVESILCAVPNATFTWVCDRHHHSTVRKLFRGLKNSERVVLMDWMEQTELLKVYDAHGLFLFPSLFEGFGKAFLEAMARGLVVVAARNGGMKDVISDGSNGFLVPTGDSGALGRRCIQLLKQPKMMQEISARARESALQFNWDRVGNETLQFYQELLRENGN